MAELFKNLYNYNRIVIVGNGFDLALGMKTSYNDFLLDYVKTCFKEALIGPYNDPLIRITLPNYDDKNKVIKKIDSCSEIQEVITLFDNRDYKSEFLQLLINQNGNKKWVDIESLYFTILMEKVEHLKKTSMLRRDFSAINDLNFQFNSLLNSLNSYINKIDSTFRIDSLTPPLLEFSNSLFEKQTDMSAYHTHKRYSFEINNPKEVLFLNFNYTNTLLKFLERNGNKNRFYINHIHGNVKDPENSIIFGYGDDTHHYYRDIELEDSLAPLKFIKSFHYPKTDNYHNLLDFMSENKYELFIIGHSCGLSDRTLLKTIFEDDNCLAIKIFHRESKDDHFYKNISISKHFSDKQKLRKRILSFNEFSVIPQMKV